MREHFPGLDWKYRTYSYVSSRRLGSERCDSKGCGKITAPYAAVVPAWTSLSAKEISQASFGFFSSDVSCNFLFLRCFVASFLSLLRYPGFSIWTVSLQ